MSECLLPILGMECTIIQVYLFVYSYAIIPLALTLNLNHRTMVRGKCVVKSQMLLLVCVTPRLAKSSIHFFFFSHRLDIEDDPIYVIMPANYADTI